MSFLRIELTAAGKCVADADLNSTSSRRACTTLSERIHHMDIVSRGEARELGIELIAMSQERDSAHHLYVMKHCQDP